MRDVNSDDPNQSSYWPNSLPAREKVDRVKALLADGATWRQVSDATGITFNRIGYIEECPQLWDTVDDEVAIERALDGDRTVLPFLTLYERETVRRSLAERLARDPWNPEYNIGPYGSQNNNHWLFRLAGLWGVDSGRLYGRLGRYNARARGRAA